MIRISEIEPKYYADGEDAYAMKRDLVVWAKQQEIEPADPDSFFKSSKDKSDHDKKKWIILKNIEKSIDNSNFYCHKFEYHWIHRFRNRFSKQSISIPE